jgi:hypothetical protein
MCATICGPLHGGLSNAIGTVNAATVWAKKNNIQFIPPPLVPVGHGWGDVFTYAFWPDLHPTTETLSSKKWFRGATNIPKSTSAEPTPAWRLCGQDRMSAESRLKTTVPAANRKRTARGGGHRYLDPAHERLCTGFPGHLVVPASTLPMMDVTTCSEIHQLDWKGTTFVGLDDFPKINSQSGSPLDATLKHFQYPREKFLTRCGVSGQNLHGKPGDFVNATALFATFMVPHNAHSTPQIRAQQFEWAADSASTASDFCPQPPMPAHLDTNRECTSMLRFMTCDVQASFNFSLTAGAMRQHYWSSNSPLRAAAGVATPLEQDAVQLPGGAAGWFTVAVHIRLGDVVLNAGKQSTDGRRMSPLWPIFALTEIMSALTSCNGGTRRKPIFRILTETPDHPDVRTVVQAFPEVSFWLPDKDESGAEAFQRMAAADVLIAAFSGFSRLASVVSRGVVIAPRAHNEKHFPLDWLDRVSTYIDRKGFRYEKGDEGRNFSKVTVGKDAGDTAARATLCLNLAAHLARAAAS